MKERNSKGLRMQQIKKLVEALKNSQIEQDGILLNIVLGKVFNQKTADALKRLNLFTIAQLISADRSKLITWLQLKLCKNSSDKIENQDDDRRNRKLTPEYVISGYNLLALSIALPAVLLDKRKKELVLVKNKNDDRKIFKITQKDKAKILGEHYCNISLANPNQFEIKKCKEYTAKMTEKVDEGSLLSIEYLEIELSKKQKLNKALELVLQKSLVRNMESNEQEFFFYMDSSLQLQKEDQIGSLTKMGLGWLQLSKDKSYIVDEDFARIRNWPSSTRPELVTI
ncbi:19957_t:CDS:2 [Gigaspora margarita]|uniref:19957_t:CDS:1 n=1 Tax=Gigaspora margarita TaxID=4874 RepID=A0ABN7W0F1_GIGMA|nr:19957_t:CDS:2 [Gigaspora margarita]